MLSAPVSLRSPTVLRSCLLVLLLLLPLALATAFGQAPAGAVVVVSAPSPESPVVADAQDSYVYYPGYGIYFNAHRHLYYYLNNGAWVNTPAPAGVTVEVLGRSPSVPMEFHDAPAAHHADMARRYPRNWKPAGDRRDGHHPEGPAGQEKPPR